MENDNNIAKKDGDKIDIAGYTLDIEMSNDYYSAFLLIDVFDENIEISEKEIEQIIAEKNIIHGIDYSMIEKIVQNPEEGKYLIAVGKKHVNGKNAEIQYKFDINTKLHPEENDDGSVDYKKMHLLKKVEKDGVLAIKILAVEGENGVTVTGKDIYAKNGKDSNFRIGKGAIISEDGLTLRAEYAGAIAFDNDKISVSEILDLRKGVGVSTGNINFHGKVVIDGIVETGFEVKATDDIVINGIVEGATIISGGSIEISKGVQGNDNAIIKCENNFKARFVNGTNLTVGGDIDLDIIMHSTVSCNGKLTAKGKNGTVVGGEYTVKKGIDAKIVGSEMGTQTILKIGIDNELLTNYKNANEDSKKYSNEFRELIKDEKQLKKKIESGNRNQLVMVKYKKALERMKEIKPLLDKATADVKEIRSQFASLKGSNLEAELVYPGTKLNITNSFFNVKDKIERVMFTKQDGDIKIIGR
ncbi:FapA family protein [Clostridiaceae bacterium HSG29]|nr:FapA family protein [Clostridiaceae bacterium HSG29]